MIKSALLAIAGLAFPLLYLFLPAMFVTESIKSGIVKIIAIFSGICLILALVTNPLLASFIFAVFGPMILIFNYMISNRYKVDTTLFVCAGVFFISVLLGSIAIGIDSSDFKSAEYINTFLSTQKEMMESLGLDFNKADILILYKRILQIMPAMLVITSIIVAYITFVITGRSLIKRGEYILQPPSFIFLRLPKGLVRALVISGLGFYLISYFDIYDFNIVFDNVFLIFYCLFIFAGISVFSFFTGKYVRNRVIATMFMFMIFLIPGSSNIFALAGIIDYALNVRNLP